MRWIHLLFVIGAVVPAAAQTRPFVRATGEGIVTLRPDQVKVNIGVTTDGATAQASVEANAVKSGSVIDALKQVLGANADIRTASYSVSPNYRYPSGGGTPTLLGYITNNVLEVTVNDVSLAGRIIDSATQAGANNIQGLRFGLKDSTAARSQALKLATQQARADAESIAAGLGAKIGAVTAAQEGSSIQPITAAPVAGTAATTTPVETGTIEVRATVTLQAELQ